MARDSTVERCVYSVVNEAGVFPKTRLLKLWYYDTIVQQSSLISMATIDHHTRLPSRSALRRTRRRMSLCRRCEYEIKSAGIPTSVTAQSNSACDQYGVDVFGRPLNAAPHGSPTLLRTARTYASGVGIKVLALWILDNFDTW